jgi:ubiquinone/menaquinone biosynthesis C-methylase UbiE
MEGLAIFRAWGVEPTGVRVRAEEIATISAALDEVAYSSVAAVSEYEFAYGQRSWASTYDSMPNILIDVEERVVHPLLGTVPVGRALDAACGTGRHARWHAAQGHEVVGVDAVEQILAVARDKVPAGHFQTGQLEDLGLPTASVDLVVCALALAHLPALDHAIAELVRGLVPGGRNVLSDIHPLSAALGFHAFFQASNGDCGRIRNQYHPMSQYISAFKTARLEIVR